MTGIRISFILPALLIAATTANTAHGQFGGFGFGGGLAGPFDNERLVDSGQGVMVAWSENKDELRGFSDTKGEWTLLKIEPQEQVVPVVEGAVAAVKLSDGMAAYSGETGTWDVVRLPADSDAQPFLSENRVQFLDSDHLYTFAASTGRWTSPTDERLQRVNEQIRLPEMIRGNQADALRKAFEQAPVVVDRFMLSGSPEGPLLLVDTRKSDVERVREIVAQFIADDPAHGGQPQNAPVPADAVTRELKFKHVKPLQMLPRVEELLNARGMWAHDINENSFNVTGTPEALDRLEQKTRELDTAENAEEWAKLPAQGREVLNVRPFGPMVGGPSAGTVVAGSADLAGFGQPRLDPLEQRALELARKVREAGEPTGEQQAELRNLVTQSLEARLQQQAAQVQQLTEKLEKVRSALDQRQQNKDRIIQRRVEELLDPSVNWESLTSRSAPVTIATTGAPIGLAGPAHIPLGMPAGVASDLFGNATSVDPISVAGSPSGGIRPRDELFTELKKQYRQASTSRDSILDNLKRIETDESEYNVEAARREVARLRTLLQNQLTEWKQVWRDYESGSRLLELNVEEANTSASADLKQAERMRQLAEKDAVAANEVRKVEATLSLSQVRLRRAEEHLRAYKSLAEDAPYLNPSTFDVSQVLEPDSGRNEDAAAFSDNALRPFPDADNSDTATRAAGSVTYERRNAVTSADAAPADRLPGIDPELIADMRSRLEGAHSEVARYAKSFPAGAKLVRLLEKPVAEWTADEKAGLQELARASFVRVEIPEGNEVTEEWRKKQFEFNMPVSVIRENALRLKENKTAWDRAWTDYQSRVRLLNLDVQEAELVLKQRLEEWGVAEMANEKSSSRAFTPTEMSARERAHAHAQIAVQRATERLQQLTDIVEMQPELNPDHFTMPEGVEDVLPAPGDN
ncbi:MAG: hypothetical protein R3C19_00465 [Planctomycetaceae bacterium]